MENRIINLEEKIAYLEQYVSDLDEVVRKMNDKVDSLCRIVQRMEGEEKRRQWLSEDDEAE